MTLAFGSIGAKTAGAPVLMPYPDSIAAGDLLIACRCTWNATANPTDQPGWTGVELSGGTGTAVDAHATRVRFEALEATGSESGTLSMEVSSGSQYGVMARYTRTGTSWDTVAGATGDDATHGADRSVTASTSLDMAPGDWLLAAVAVDTDDALTITSPTFTAAGITFGAVNRRTSGAGSGTGNDGNIELFDAAITAGNAIVAPSFTFTTATSQCGPIAFLRIRELGAGGGTVNLGPATVTLSAQPVTVTPGAVNLALGPATMTLTAQPVTVTPQPVQLTAGPAVVTLTAQPVQPVTAGALNLSPATMTLQAQPVTPVPGPVTIAAGPATVTLSAQPVVPALPPSNVALAPAVVTLQARPVTVTLLPVQVQLVAAVLTLQPQPVVPQPGSVTVQLVPAVLLLVAVAVQPQLPGGGDYPVAVVVAVGRHRGVGAVGRGGRYSGPRATGRPVQ